MLQFVVISMFLALPIALTRQRGSRFIGGLGAFLTLNGMALTLFAIFRFGDLAILSCLYGPRAALTGSIYVVKGRHYIELSDGTRYNGIRFFLWAAGQFLSMACIFFTLRNLYQRFPRIQKLIAFFQRRMSQSARRTPD